MQVFDNGTIKDGAPTVKVVFTQTYSTRVSENDNYDLENAFSNAALSKQG